MSFNIIQSNSKYSFASPRRQYFSLPFSLINYLPNDCTSPEVFEKLQKSCKHFFSKKNIIVVDVRICSSNNSCWYSLPKNGDNDDYYKKFELQVNLKLWLNNYLQITKFTLSPFLNYIYRCNLTHLAIFKEDLTFKEICFMLNGKTIKYLLLDYLNIKHEDGTPVTMDLIMAQCPNIQKFFYSNMCETFSSNTFEKLNQLKFNYKLVGFELIMFHVDGVIDSNILCQYLKTNVASLAWGRIKFKCDYSTTEFNNFHSTVNIICSDYKKLSVQLNPS